MGILEKTNHDKNEFGSELDIQSYMKILTMKERLLYGCLSLIMESLNSLMVSCQKGPTRHAYAWQIGPFWQDTLVIWRDHWVLRLEQNDM